MLLLTNISVLLLALVTSWHTWSLHSLRKRLFEVEGAAPAVTLDRAEKAAETLDAVVAAAEAYGGMRRQLIAQGFSVGYGIPVCSASQTLVRRVSATTS